MPAGRRRVADAIGATLAGLWPVALTLGVLGNPGRYSPTALYSGLGSVQLRSLASQPTTDPNLFATAYSLGVRGASLLVHGHLGWWNPYEGMGSPLVGELQSGALFPLSPLLLLHDGSLIFHLALEAIAGVATYFLLRELRCSPVVATLGGMLFATNGTFAWLQNAAFDPVCFLPVLLLGVERSRHAAAEGRGGGWRWLAAGVALALVAGFVEVAVLGLGLAALFAVQRAFRIPRDRLLAYARKVVVALAVGAAVAAPVLVAFGDYLSVGFVAEHAGNTAGRSLAAPYLAMTVAPYLFGRIFGTIYPAVHSIWGAVGGYASFSVLALAIASLFGRRERGLRLTLMAWVGVALADTMGVAPFRQIFSSIPGIDHVVLYRYLPATWELALVVLAALALRDLSTRSRASSAIAVTSGVIGAALVLLIGLAIAPSAVRLSRVLASQAFKESELLVLLVAAGLTLAVLAPLRLRALAVGAVAVAEAGVLFCVPLLSWPATEHVDVAVEQYLEAHAGSYRFAGLGIPSPNLGSVIGVAQLDVVDLPVPKAYVSIAARLDPYENPTIFTGNHRVAPGEPTPVALLVANFAYYEQLGVRFVVTRADHPRLFPPADRVRLAYRDRRFDIWALPHPTPLYRANGCRVRALGFGAVRTDCRHASVLLVNELYLPGWSASVNGASATVHDRAKLQAVALPAGSARVSLSFLPPHEQLAGVAALVGALVFVLPFGPLAVRRRRRREEKLALAGRVQRFSQLGETTTATTGTSPPDPPTGAISLADLDLDPGEPTTAAPAVVAAGMPAGAGGPTRPGAEVDAAAGDPPTLSVEATGPGDD